MTIGVLYAAITDEKKQLAMCLCLHLTDGESTMVASMHLKIADVLETGQVDPFRASPDNT
jgi:hypothetical protein